MNRYRLLLTAATLTAAVMSSAAGGAQQPGAQDQPGADELTPLPWGPVHEAYAQPYSADPQPAPLVPKQPPEPIEEMPPDVKPEGDNVQWMPGYFAWDEEYKSFLWVSGFWRDVPPGREWLPGHWEAVEGGWRWAAGYWADVNATQVEYLQAPPESIDAGPSTPPPDAESVYAPGCWVHHETRWLWRPGFWVPVRPGWVYMPAQYRWTRAGHVFVEGYWDRPLQRRGLLFAPVWARWDTFLRPNYIYRPSYVVSAPALSAALFVRNDRPATYYFGNYFAPEYRRNFVPWVDYRVRRNVPDPLLGYYRARERDFATALVNRYEARLAGREAPPPSSFKKQTEILQNVTVNQTIRVGKQTLKVNNVAETVRGMTVLAPLEKVDRKELNLRPVAKERLQEERKAVQELRSLAQERRKLEASLAAKAPAKAAEPRRVELPKLAARAKQVKVDAPPRPPLPKPKQEAPPPPKKDVQPPKKEKDPPPPPKKEVQPPKKEVIPPLPKKEKDPPPPPPKKEVTPPPPPKKDIPPPPPPKKEKDPPPKKDKDDKRPEGKPVPKNVEKQPPPGPDVKPPPPKKEAPPKKDDKRPDVKPPPGPDVKRPKDERRPKANDKEKDKKGKKDDKAASAPPPVTRPRVEADFLKEPPIPARWLGRRGWVADQ